MWLNGYSSAQLGGLLFWDLSGLGNEQFTDECAILLATIVFNCDREVAVW